MKYVEVDKKALNYEPKLFSEAVYERLSPEEKSKVYYKEQYYIKMHNAFIKAIRMSNRGMEDEFIVYKNIPKEEHLSIDVFASGQLYVDATRKLLDLEQEFEKKYFLD